MDLQLLKDMVLPGIPILEKIIRPIVVYLFLILALRLSGKREVAQLNPFDLVVLLTLSNTVQNAIIGNDNSLIGGLIGATTLLVTNYIVVRFLYSSPKLDQLVEGSPVFLIEHGRINSKKMEHELVTIAELESAARKQGFDSLVDIDFAVLEPGGAITFSRQKGSGDRSEYQEIMKRLDLIERKLDLKNKTE